MNNCAACGIALETEAGVSDLFGRKVCLECYAIEKNGWKKLGGGSVIIILLWIVVKLIAWLKIIGATVSSFFPLSLLVVWYGVCMFWSYRKLRRRKINIRNLEKPTK